MLLSTTKVIDGAGRFSACALPLVLLAMAAAQVGCHKLTGSADSAFLPTSAADDWPQIAHADDHQWPAFRGGNHHGVAQADDLPLHWSAAQHVRWRVAITGRGNSSPVVWDDNVLLTTLVKKGYRDELALLCLDRTTGAVRWQRELGRAIGETHDKNGHASATVATDGELVFAYFGPKGLFCFSIDGQRRWQRVLAPKSHKWGLASSPMLVGGYVYQLCDTESESFLVALRKSDGRESWRAQRTSDGCWTTPTVVHAIVDGRPRAELVVNGTGSSDGSKGFVISYEPHSGRELWRVRGTTDLPCPAAIVADDLLISSSGGNGPIMAIRAGGSGDVTGSRIVWEVASGGPYVPTGVAYQGRLYLVSDAGVASCFDLKDGRQLWQNRLGSPVSASLVAAADRIYVAAENGDVYVLAAGDEFNLLATNSINEPIFATPAVAHNQLFLRSDRHLWSIGNQPVADPPVSEPVAKAAPAAEEPEPGRDQTTRSPSDLPMSSLLDQQ